MKAAIKRYIKHNFVEGNWIDNGNTEFKRFKSLNEGKQKWRTEEILGKMNERHVDMAKNHVNEHGKLKKLIKRCVTKPRKM